jgi:hypothetical protein
MVVRELLKLLQTLRPRFLRGAVLQHVNRDLMDGVHYVGRDVLALVGLRLEQENLMLPL